MPSCRAAPERAICTLPLTAGLSAFAFRSSRATWRLSQAARRAMVLAWFSWPICPSALTTTAMVMRLLTVEGVAGCWVGGGVEVEVPRWRFSRQPSRRPRLVRRYLRRPRPEQFCRLHGLGLVVAGQRLEPGRAVLACRVLNPHQRRRRCGREGIARDSVTSQLAHEPFGWRPTTLGHDPPLPVRGLRARVAPRHHQGRRTPREAVGPPG